MEKREIEIEGKSYPVRVTMGALVRFHQMYGIDINTVSEINVEYMCAWYFCCIQGACNADKVEFPYDFMTFCDLLTSELCDRIAQLLGEADKEEKKTGKKSK